MKFFTALIVILFSFHLEFALSHFSETSTADPTPTSPRTTTFTPTTYSSQNDYLDNISIQDVLSSDIDASEKIEKKIINAFKHYASNNCSAYKKIHLSTEGFTFPQSSITVGLGWANAIFYNIRVSESSLDSSGEKSYSSFIGCDSTRMAKIEIKLPKDIEISADIKVNKISNTSGEFQSPSDILNTGSIFVTLKNTSISKQYSTQTDNVVNNTSKLFYSKSMVSLDIATNFQMQIYNILETFFDEVESPLKQFLIQKLDAELTGITLADDCSRFLNSEKSSKKVNLPFLNNKLNNLYVIPNTKLEMWKGVSLSAGPILIDGLASFNSTELLITMENEASSWNGHNTESYYYYSTTPRYNNPTNKMTVKIKTNDLKGKVDWSYNSKQRSVSFIIEFILFEMKKSDTSQYESSTENYYRYYSTTRRTRSRYGSNTGSNNNEIISLHLGNLQIKSSKSSTCENESEFVNFVLSEYLKAVITDSLKNSLDKKVQNESLFVDSD